jgi:hypothetical protein
MEVDQRETSSGSKEQFNGTVPIKRARMDLTSTKPTAAQLQKQKDAVSEYGRGRKIRGGHPINTLQVQCQSLTSSSIQCERQETPREPQATRE